jgi:hypothetical protein
MEPVVRFVQPHFQIAAAARIGAAILIEFLGRTAWERPAGDGERTLIRRRTPGKHVWGERWRARGRTVLHVPSSDTAFDLADDGGHARVYVADGSRYHASDLLRDVMWELAAAEGTFIHAAAVTDSAGVIAVTGPKGAGKTTTAVDLVHSGCAFYTGDVLFVADTTNAAYSFPDYPHVGWGTLRTFPRLLSAVTSLGLRPSDDAEKVLLPHDLYQTVLGVAQSPPPLPLHTVVVPDLDAQGPARIVPVPPRPELLARMERQTSDPGEGWEPFLAMVGAQAAAKDTRHGWLESERELRWYARLGAGRVPVEQLRAVRSGA